MKRIIYFISIVSGLALYSCSGQYDNIERYATDETVYVGKFGDMPEVKIGYNRVEINLLSDRLTPDDIYLGKAKKTVVEYDESDGIVRHVFDSVCSWVNITGLTTPKTYIFRIYTEDESGNKSIAVQALGRPFTDEELNGFSFPLPNVIPTPTTMEFRWTEESGLSSSLFNFAELIYSYTNSNGKTVSDTLTSKEPPRFSILDLLESDNIPISVTCKIIPIMETGPILDTVTMYREFFAKTVSVQEYLDARILRPIVTAMIDTADQTRATITWSGISDHLAWTEIRYEHSNGTFEDVHIDNRVTETLCTDIRRGVKFKIRCAYIPPGTSEELITEWKEQEMFMVKYDLKDWVVVPRHGNHPWGGDGVGSQTAWSGGHPMLILDDDPRSGWHSRLGTAFPQLLIIDMKASRKVSKFILKSVDGGYWNNVELYLTDDLSMPGYVSHTVNWSSTPEARVDNYSAWVTSMIALVPANPPVASWGSPIAKTQAKKAATLSFLLPETLQGQFLIVLFPDNNLGWATYIDVHGIEVYSE